MKAILLFALVTLFVSCPAALARPGDLDSTFGVNGIRIDYFNNNKFNRLKYCDFQDNDKIVALGSSGDSVILVRYKNNSTIDSTFGKDGVVNIGFQFFDVPFFHMSTQFENRILILGEIEHELLLLRYLKDGKLDSTFNNNGLLRMPNYGAYTLLVLKNGKILLPLSKYPNSTNLNFAVMRLKADGSVDSSFGLNGLASKDFEYEQGQAARNLGVSENGDIYAGGFTGVYPNRDIAIVKYLNNGKVDTTFGKDGIFTIDQGPYNSFVEHLSVINNYIIMQGVVLTDQNNDKKHYQFLMKIDNNGIIDSAFGIKGLAQILIQEDDAVYTLRSNDNGELFVSGTSSIMETRFFYIVKYKPNGVIDSTFGIQGKIMKLDGTTASGGWMGFQNNRRIILAGTTVNDSSMGFILYRFLNDNSTDMIYNSNPEIISTIAPNPVNSNFSFHYTVSKPGIVSLSLYDTQGNKIYDLIKNLYRDSGTYENNFELNSLSIGQYFLLYKTNEMYKLLKLIIE